MTQVIKSEENHKLKYLDVDFVSRNSNFWILAKSQKQNTNPTIIVMIVSMIYRSFFSNNFLKQDKQKSYSIWYSYHRFNVPPRTQG